MRCFHFIALAVAAIFAAVTALTGLTACDIGQNEDNPAAPAADTTAAIATLINGMAATIAEAVARDNRRWNITNNGASDLAKYTTETNADTRITWRAAVQRMVDKYSDTYAAVARTY